MRFIEFLVENKNGINLRFIDFLVENKKWIIRFRKNISEKQEIYWIVS